MNDRFIELVNREIDGLLSVEEKREQEQLSAGDSEARQFRENHLYAAGLLGEAKVATAPAHLKGSIMSSVRKIAAQEVPVKVRRPKLSIGSFFQFSTVFPLAFGVAAGIILTVIFWGNSGLTSLDGTGMTGTLVNWSAQGAVGEPVKIAIGENRVSARYVTSKSNAVIIFDVVGSGVDVSVQGTSAVAVLSVAQQAASGGAVHFQDGVVQISHSSANSYAVTVDRNGASVLTLEIGVTADGESIAKPMTIEWH